MLNIFEIIIYTSSLEEYANPVIDMFDPMKRIEIRLFRENCIIHDRKIVKTLEVLKRKMKDVIIIDVILQNKKTINIIFDLTEFRICFYA